jgi:hypothetical protein
LSAHIDITKAPTVGHIWRFAGLDPTSRWEKGEKRPWNASLKVLCWKIGESFVKVSNHEKDFYGHLWRERKELETGKNENGDYVGQAREKLERFNIGKGTEAWLWYAGCLSREAAVEIRTSPAEKRMGLTKKLAGEPESGIRMLPPAHVHARSKRWVVKLFLAHWHHVAYELHYGTEPPKPYAITQLHHAHEARVNHVEREYHHT